MTIREGIELAGELAAAILMAGSLATLVILWMLINGSIP